MGATNTNEHGTWKCLFPHLKLNSIMIITKCEFFYTTFDRKSPPNKSNN